MEDLIREENLLGWNIKFRLTLINIEISNEIFFIFAAVNKIKMKKLYLSILLISFGLQLISQSDKDFRVYWDNALKAESKDGSTKIKTGCSNLDEAMWTQE